MNGLNGGEAPLPPPVPVVEELWTAPSFSVSPGFNDDFNRLLGAQSQRVEAAPVAAPANTLLQYSMNMNEDLGLSPIPHVAPTSPPTPFPVVSEVREHVVPPSLQGGGHDDDRRKHLMERGRAALEDWRSGKEPPTPVLPTADHAALERHLKSAEETIAALRDEVSTLSDKETALETTVGNLQQQLSTADESAGLGKALQDAEDRAAKANALAEQKSEVASSLAIEIANLQTALEATGNTRAKENIHVNDDKSVQMEALMAGKVKAEQEATKWEALYQESFDKGLMLEREVDAARAEINSELSILYEDRVSEMNIKLNTVTREKDSRILTIEKEREALLHEVDELRNESLKEDVAALNAENERLAGMLQEREQGNVGQIARERDELKLQISELTSSGPSERVTHLEGQILTLTAELARKQEAERGVDYANNLMARNELLESQLRDGGVDTSELLRAKQKEKEWELERERWATYQKRVEAEAERQRSTLDEYEDTVGRLRTELEKHGGVPPEVDAVFVESGGAAAGQGAAHVPVPVPPAPVQPTVVPSTAPIPPPPTQQSKLLAQSRATLPFSVMVFEAIFSLGGLLPSTRHAQHAHLTGEFKV